MKFIFLLVSAFFALAQVNGMCAEQPAGYHPKQKLVDQKSRLLDTLLKSAAAKTEGSGPVAVQVAELLEQARLASAHAKLAAVEGHWDEASSVLDQAIKSVASIGKSDGANSQKLAETALRQNVANMLEQVSTYRSSLELMRNDSKLGQGVQQLLSKVDAMVSGCNRLLENSQLSDANRQATSAYLLITSEIARLRAGQEVVLALKFDSPADEYAYELKRFAGNLSLAEMMIKEGRGDGAARTEVSGFMAEGHRLKVLAQRQAQAEKFQDAVLSLEQANGQFGRAFMAMGLTGF